MTYALNVLLLNLKKVIDKTSYNIMMVKCSCGVSYYGATFEARHKHETSQRHIKALGRNKKLIIKHIQFFN